MKHAIRALGVATSILWMVFLFFVVTAGYSALNFKAETEKAQVSTSNETLRILIPFKISNAGYYEITELNVTTKVLGRNGTVISKSTTLIPRVPKESSLSKSHNVSINIKELLLNFPDYLVEDSNLTLENTVQLRFAKVLPICVSANMSMQWGAPLRGLHVKQKSLRPYNSTHSEVAFEISFENGSPYFSVVGTMETKIYNEQGELLASTTSRLKVASNSVFNEEISVLAERNKLTSDGEVYLYFDTYTFKCGPLVVHYGSQ